MAADAEAHSTAILPMLRSSVVTATLCSPNERVSTKIDMVNPIPPRQATAASLLHVAPEGISPTFILIANALARVMPKGLPNTSPSNTPNPTEPSSGEYPKGLVADKSGNMTPALASANIGMMA